MLRFVLALRFKYLSPNPFVVLVFAFAFDVTCSQDLVLRKMTNRWLKAEETEVEYCAR